MSERNPPQKPFIHRTWVRALLSIGVFGVFIVFAIFIYGSMTRDSFSAKVEEWREAGYPTTLAELDEYYTSVSPEENAALLFLQAADALELPPQNQLQGIPFFGSRVGAIFDRPLPESTLAKSDSLLAKNSESLTLLRAGAALPHARYPVDFTLMPMASMNHLTTIRQLARLSNLEVIVNANYGDIQKALDSLRNSVALAKSLNSEPVLISHLVHIAIGWMYVETLQSLLSIAQLSDEDFASIQEMIRNLHDPESFQHGIRGEAALFLGQFLGQRVTRNRFTTLLLSSDNDAYLEQIELYISAVQSDGSAILSSADVLGRLSMPKYKISRLRPMSSIVAPAFSRAFEAHIRLLVQLELAEVGIAVEKYRATEDALPDSLDALVPDYLESVPIDPYTGSTVSYVKEWDHYAIYSIGSDDEDDGGSNEGGREGDIVFRVRL